MNITEQDNFTEQMVSSPSIAPAWTYVQTTEIVIAAVGILSNYVVVVVMLRTPSLRSQLIFRLTASLAVADLLASAFLVPRTLRGFFDPPTGTAGEIYCRTVKATILWVSFVASTYTLVAITVERYVAIVHPMQYVSRKGTIPAWPIVVVVWLVALIVQSFCIYNNSYDPESGSCNYQWPFGDWYQTFVGIGLFFATYFFPGTILLSAFFRILLALRKGERMFRESSADSGSSIKPARIRARHRIIKMYLAVCLAFLVCWGPNQFLFLILNFTSDLNINDVIYSFSRILAGLNSCLNPFIYAFWSRSFRTGFLAIFCGSGRRRSARYSSHCGGSAAKNTYNSR